MSNIGYVSLSQATALERSLNMTAHNLANLNTTGFKARHALFEAVDHDAVDGGISFVMDKGSYLDLKHGALVPTGNPFDIAMEQNGWFAFQMNGGGVGYSRNGQLVVNAEGQLTNVSGQPLLDAGGAPIVLPEEAASNVSISSDGVIEGAEGAVLGNIGVFDIPEEASMQPLGAGFYGLPEDAAQPQVLAEARIKQGMVEASNVNAVLEMTKLISVQRAYQNSMSLMEEDNGLLQGAIQRLGKSV
jgi:flagellar basal-body rod protein FlgF